MNKPSKHFESLTDKYRPIMLEDVVGQDHVVKSLRGMFQGNRNARAIMLSGPFGSGKTTLARMIARYRNCQKPNENHDPCMECSSCKAMDGLRDDGSLKHPDVLEINMGDARGIDTIRELKETIRLRPRYNQRIIILDEVHQLTPAGQNALLKPLEEPPKGTTFILATTDAQKLLRTIQSRCMNLKLKRVTTEATTELLMRVAKAEKFKIKEEQASKISQAVLGHPRDALKTLEKMMSYVTGGGKSLKDVLPQMVEEAMEASPEIVAFKYLEFVLSGNSKGAMRLCQHASSADRFIACVLVAATQVLKASMDRSLSDPYWKRFIEPIMKLKPKVTLWKANSVQRYLMDRYAEAKTYLQQDEDLLTGTTAGLSLLVETNDG